MPRLTKSWFNSLLQSLRGGRLRNLPEIRPPLVIAAGFSLYSAVSHESFPISPVTLNELKAWSVAHHELLYEGSRQRSPNV